MCVEAEKRKFGEIQTLTFCHATLTPRHSTLTLCSATLASVSGSILVRIFACATCFVWVASDLVPARAMALRRNCHSADTLASGIGFLIRAASDGNMDQLKEVAQDNK